MKRIIALGFFDGVHLGHGALIERAKALAAETGCAPAVLTFDSYPQAEVSGAAAHIITSVHDRRRLIERQYGVEDVIVLHFDRALMNTPPEAFILQLRSQFGAAGFVCGYDFRFGQGGRGNADVLSAYCAANGLHISVVGEVTVNGERVSSTAIRGMLAAGELEEAEQYLGHLHTMTGDANAERVMGNISIRIVPDTGVMLPMPGMYDTRLVAPDGRQCAAVTGVGENGTVSRLYGAGFEPVPGRLTVEFLRYIEQ